MVNGKQGDDQRKMQRDLERKTSQKLLVSQNLLGKASLEQSVFSLRVEGLEEEVAEEHKEEPK
jgi:hypothetical protein